MKLFIRISLLLTPVFILLFCTSTTNKTQPGNKIPGAKKNFAVIELFTSQGCSSCPPADRLFGTYTNKENVYPLSFHVDYWNRLGWKDPFSDALFTQRQSYYVGVLNSSGAYTPQAVINGQTEMVGSEESTMAAAIKKFQGEESTADLVINDVTTADSSITFFYNLHGQLNNSVLNMALVQNKVTTSIKAGENKGVTLTNYNVVRSFKTAALNKEGTNKEILQLPPGIAKSDLTLIVFAQQTATGKIFAAAKSSL